MRNISYFIHGHCKPIFRTFAL